eukprot:SM000085S23201  [mRNA]  locus=s85:23466:26170:- [translate_table: standard]
MRVGVAVLHLGTGEEAGVAASSKFPLASIVKLHLLEGTLSLEVPVCMDEADKCIGSGVLRALPRHVLRAVTLSRVGGLVQQLGLQQTAVELSQRQAYVMALGRAPSMFGQSSQQIAARWQTLSSGQRRDVAVATEKANRGLPLVGLHALECQSEAAFMANGGADYKQDRECAAAVDNHGSPRDTVRLLAAMAQGPLLLPHLRAVCFLFLSQQQFGRRRLRRRLPRSATIYHKTGTILGVCNDAGIIKLGTEYDQVAVAAFIDKIDRLTEVFDDHIDSPLCLQNHEKEAEVILAQIGRLVCCTYMHRWIWSKR